MQILIIEDEEAAVRRLVKLLNEIAGDFSIIDTLDSIESSVQWLGQNTHPDLILMDIHLADGSSFEIFEHVNITCPIIFVTAYDEYAVRAFRVNAIDYLLKPIKLKELEDAISKTRQSESSDKYGDLIEKLQGDGIIKRKNRVLVRIGQNINLIDLDDAAYFYTQDKITFAVFPENRRYPVEHSLEHLDQILNSNKFFRINRQLILGLDSISEMYSYSKSRVKIKLNPPTKFDVIVSTERSPKFKKWLTDT